MPDQFSRTRRLLGDAALEKLRRARVAVFGIGGVGGYAVEVLSRSGVGALDLIDSDKVCVTNINRQIYALLSTVGQYKVDVAQARIRDINPECQVRTYPVFYLPENAARYDFSSYDYIVDCIDTVTAKLDLVSRAYAQGISVISSMGAANKLDPTAFRVADIYKTSMDPLARVMRRELKKRGVLKLKCVYSEEPAIAPLDDPEESLPEGSTRRSIPASNAFVPAAAGLIIGGEVVKDLIAR
ncbi:MAG: tRNA threonylcarbamoyladenosine dehydratase [Proteobacteria bacterium]|nr:tRNA threonylcarbamoyladenosine dehydratase [Pseudomonadota bacterium]